jgi:hypothetical protein
MVVKSSTKGLLVMLQACAVLCCLARPASAQNTSAQVYGTVKDTQGAVIPGVTLVLTSETRGTKSAPVVTNASGDYVFPVVAADTYTLEATMSGFKTYKRAGIQVSPGNRVSVPAIELAVGGTQETVDVKAEAPTIQAQSGERSFTIQTAAVENLPISNRTFSALASLAPGMSNSGGTNPARRQTLSSTPARPWSGW